MKFIFSEKQINNISKNKRILLEQSYRDGLIPAKGYQIIEDIEGNMGSTQKQSDGTYAPVATPHRGDEKESVIDSIISQYPEIKNKWMIIDPLFRTQIYSFMFQAGSESDLSSSKNYRWLSGLAQSIDSSIDRSKVSSDPVVRKRAVDIVSNAINDGTINSYYNAYKQKVKEQYNSLQPANPSPTKDDLELWKAKKEIVWLNRPQIIDEMWNGVTIQQIIKKYYPKGVTISVDQPTPTPTPTPSPLSPPTPGTDKTALIITANTLKLFREEIKSKTKGISISNKMKLKSSPAYRLTIYPGEKKIKSMTFIYDNISMENLEKRFNEKIKSANPTAKVIKKGQVSNISKNIWYMLILFK